MLPSVQKQMLPIQSQTQRFRYLESYLDPNFIKKKLTRCPALIKFIFLDWSESSFYSELVSSYLNNIRCSQKILTAQKKPTKNTSPSSLPPDKGI